MNIDTVVQLISTVGFPIVTCGVLAWYVYKQGEKHDHEVENLRKTLEENTRVLSRLYDLLDIYFKGIERENENGAQ